MGKGKLTESTLRKVIRQIIREETEYEKFFSATLKKFGVSSPEDLDDTKKKEFFDYVDKNWEAENETD